jgi:hypothetical protein
LTAINRIIALWLLGVTGTVLWGGPDDLVWLKNSSLEAGFSAESGIRLEVLRAPSGENLLRESSSPGRGLKTWIMTPSEDLQLRDLLSETPGTVERLSNTELRILASSDNRLGLNLEWLVHLGDREPLLEIVHRVHHNGDTPLHIGIWSLIAVAPETVLRVPFSRSPNLPRNSPNDIAVFPFTNLADTRIHSSPESLTVSIRQGVEDGSLKLGLVQWDGRLLVERGAIVLESSVPYDPAALYPEGGSNITLYASPANRPDTMGEGEHVGPLRILKPGQSIEMRQTLRLLDKFGQ